MTVERPSSLVRVLRPLLDATEPLEVTLDLRRLEFSEPVGLAVLASAFDQAHRLGHIATGSRLLPPANQGIRNYIRRMDLFEEILAWDTPEPFKRRRPQTFTPLILFHDGRGGRAGRPFAAAARSLRGVRR